MTHTYASRGTCEHRHFCLTEELQLRALGPTNWQADAEQPAHRETGRGAEELWARAPGGASRAPGCKQQTGDLVPTSLAV